MAAHVEREILDKGRKAFRGGPYAEVLGCLFTDEPALTVEFARAELAGHAFGPVKKLTSAYLLFSYDPGTKSSPVIAVRLQR